MIYIGEDLTTSGRFIGISMAAAMLVASAVSSLPYIPSSNSQLIQSRLMEDTTSSQVDRLPGEVQSWQQVRVLRIKALRGKYKTVLPSSEEYARRKQQEIELEG